eukprot:1558210-Karenia_brevis.AAC.1
MQGPAPLKLLDMRMWRPKPKNHQWTHLIEDFVRPTKINPKHTYCYRDEDFCGRMKTSIQKCHGTTLAPNALRKYLLYLKIKLADIRDGRG